MVGGEEVGHLAAVNRVCPLGQQMQVMPTFSQKANRRLEVPEEPEMRGRKEDLHPDVGALTGEAQAPALSPTCRRVQI